ncbi:MAG: hypothetical protein LBO81_05890 [Clostridiales Family XIII bacterium]|jgi:putative flippase GtrA|nr:hypothetical protein [Clostridiales Family XIII bacterium]
MSKPKALWAKFQSKHPGMAQFLLFFIISNGVTVLQLILMPTLKALLDGTDLLHIAFRAFPVGHDLDGSQYYVFNYEAGPVRADGSGGGLAYFLAVEITLAIAQTINFFAQRNITFRANNSVAKAAFWYVAAYVAITLLAGALQGLYKAPVYSSLIAGAGDFGRTLADFITMFINSVISFWVFFPIFKVIFRNKPKAESVR